MPVQNVWKLIEFPKESKHLKITWTEFYEIELFNPLTVRK